MKSPVQGFSRRTFLGTTIALGVVAAMEVPTQAVAAESAYAMATWQQLVGSRVLIGGESTYVRKVTEGVGSAFHVSFDGSRLNEGLLPVSHAVFGTVDLFICVQGDHALCTFNNLTKDR